MMDLSFIRPFCLPLRAMQEASRGCRGFFRVQTGLCAVMLGLFMALASPVFADDLFEAFNAFREQSQSLKVQTQDAAARAKAHPFAPPEGFALSGEYSRRISDFNALAKTLVRHLDARGGPKDLRCIYRGMAEDAQLQLVALHHAKNAAAQAAILDEMTALFIDAIDVTPQSPAALADHHDEGAAQCLAQSQQKIETLPKAKP